MSEVPPSQKVASRLLEALDRFTCPSDTPSLLLSPPPSPPPSLPPCDDPPAPAGNLCTDMLDDLCLLSVLRQLEDDMDVVRLRAVSSRVRKLADIVLEEKFRRRWGVREVAAPPPASPAFAATRASSFVLCHRLEGKETLAAVAVRHGCDVVALKRINNLLSDHAMYSRSHLFVPVPDAAAAAAGQRVAFLHDENSSRRMVVVCRDGEPLPGQLSGSGSGRQAGRNHDFVVAKLAAMLQRALRIDQPTAAYYVSQANCDIRQAIAKFEEDKRWENVMRSRRAR
ncbi:hypothetical protein CHLNCDRAFT_52157 [Chlorella variabilis]|uniref:LysM domain-containing protein n=1 Tax=Chlorella variabilis TaxID=554065 RepID=E1ZDP3_CHLVA|nr:hypothetical protein CHLNCDRAFT_52157 [Chlorella variabilis]EFN56056.1 hypothetical protein CHLNCDRAFT_52157 [Chlorella variabilis]|eukprot:XP_005848158.1 hypothetical protein CHLNCDRAFT_52157 [Chlorella variabilis]